MKEYREERIEKGGCFSICLVLAILYFVPLPLNMWTFHFKHANVFHLIVNMIAITTILKQPKVWSLVIGYLLSSLIWSTTSGDIVGFSAIIFFVWGSKLPSIILSIQDDKVLYKYIAAIALTLIFPLFIHAVSFTMHAAPFVMAASGVFIYQLYKQYQYDIKDLKL